MRSRPALSLIALLLACRLRRPAGNHAAAGRRNRAAPAWPRRRRRRPRLGPAKVGLLVPLSGPGAALGEDLLDAAQLALFDVGRTDLELLPRDTGDQPQKAEAAARSALDAGAELLIGPLYGRSALAVAPVAAARGVNVIAFSNDASVARPGLYVLGFRPEEQIERIVRYAAAQGRTRFAALAPEDAYGARALDRLAFGRGADPGRDGRGRRDLSAGQRQPDGGGGAGGSVRPAGRAAAGSRRRTDTGAAAGAGACR